MLGCLLIGIAVGLVDSRQSFSPELRQFIMVGLLGGFTTYSTFGLETFALLREANYLGATANVVIHVVLGLVMVWAGFALVSK